MIRSNYTNKICAVIPFYNERDFLLDVVTGTSNYVHKVFAVNDGSTDGSEKILMGFNNVEVLNIEKNCGKGYALKVGQDEAIKQLFDVIVTLDADNQHDPKFIPDFLRRIDKYDLVIGNRMTNKSGMPVQRIISNNLTSMLLTLKTGQIIIDSQCGFRAYKRKVLENTHTRYHGYEAESEMIINASRNGFKIGFVEIPTIYGTEQSKMKSFEAITGFLKVLFG